MSEIHKNHGDDPEGDGDLKKEGDGGRETETAINECTLYVQFVEYNLSNDVKIYQF